MNPLRTVVATATLVAFVSSSSVASAQIYKHRLRLESDTPDTEYKVYAGKKSKVPWLECTAPCLYAVPNGKYRIEAVGPDMASATTVATVEGETRVVTHGASSGGKTAGLVLGIVGASVFGLGLLTAALSSTACVGDGQCKGSGDQEKSDATTRDCLALAGIGAVASLVGWAIFANNRTEVDAMEVDGAPRIVSVGVGPTTGGGAAFGALGTF